MFTVVVLTLGGLPLSDAWTVSVYPEIFSGTRHRDGVSVFTKPKDRVPSEMYS